MTTSAPSGTQESAPAKLRIDVWSDVVCPFCWIGKAHLDQALRRLGMEGEVEVVFRSFELNPGMARSEPIAEHLAHKYGSPEQARRIMEQVTRMGAAAGLPMEFERAVAASTFDAHRVAQLAQSQGVGNAVMDRLMRGYFAEGLDVADPATLRRLAAEAGMDAGSVERLLASDECAEAVRADVAMARAYHVRGVPFFVLDGRYAVSGAQPVELFVKALAQVRAERSGAAPLAPAEEGHDLG